MDLNALLKNDEFSTLDENTIDWELKNKGLFSKSILNLKCPLCGYVLINQNDKILKHCHKNPDITGCETKCGNCEKEFYIHYPVTQKTLSELFGENQ